MNTSLLQIARTFREKGIPCDVIWMDIDYMDGFRCFTFDKACPSLASSVWQFHRHKLLAISVEFSHIFFCSLEMDWLFLIKSISFFLMWKNESICCFYLFLFGCWSPTNSEVYPFFLLSFSNGIINNGFFTWVIHCLWLFPFLCLLFTII